MMIKQCLIFSFVFFLAGCATSNVCDNWSMSEQYYKPDKNAPLTPIHVLSLCVQSSGGKPIRRAREILNKNSHLCPGGFHIREDSMKYYEGLRRVSFFVDCKG